MATFYGEMQSFAKEMLVEFGMPMNVERLTNGTYQKVSSGRGAFTEDRAANESQSSSSGLARTSLRTRKAVLDTKFKTVEVNDRLIADKTTYTIVAVTTHRPTTTTIAFEIEVTA